MKPNTQKQQEIRETALGFIRQNHGLYKALVGNARQFFGQEAVLKFVISGAKKKRRVEARFTNTRLVRDEIHELMAKNEPETSCDKTDKILAELKNPAGATPWVPSIPVVTFSRYGFSFMRVCQVGNN